MAMATKADPDARPAPTSHQLTPGRGAFAVLLAAALHRILALTLLLMSGAAQRSFDASGEQLVLLPSLAQPGGSAVQALAGAIRPLLPSLVRWDTLHFLGAAAPRPIPTPFVHEPAWWEAGYAYEHTLAFQPGLPVVLRWAGYIGTPKLPSHWQVEQALVLTTLFAAIAGALAPVLLFLTTTNIWAAPRFALVAALLSIWSPSPATLISPTPEPYFAFFTLLGLWVLSHLHLPAMTPSTRGRALRYALVLLASAPAFAAASCFRANGILAAGFFLWYSIWWPALSTSCFGFRLYPVLVLAGLAGLSVCIAPFILLQVWAYERFCLPHPQAIWCGEALDKIGWLKLLPHILSKSVYSYVQGTYWEVGLVRYWTAAQIPNFVLAAPVLYLSIYKSLVIYHKGHSSVSSSLRSLVATLWSPFSALVAAWRFGRARPTSPIRYPLDSMAHPATVPFLLLLWATGWLLLLDAHVQIALRFASPVMMGLWWTLAAFLIHALASPQATSWDKWEAKILIAYLVVWNLTSLVLYAGFYPPA